METVAPACCYWTEPGASYFRAQLLLALRPRRTKRATQHVALPAVTAFLCRESAPCDTTPFQQCSPVVARPATEPPLHHCRRGRGSGLDFSGYLPGRHRRIFLTASASSHCLDDALAERGTNSQSGQTVSQNIVVGHGRNSYFGRSH